MKFNYSYLFIGLFVIVLLSGIGSASDYLPHKTNTNLALTISSNNATACNLSYITYPDNTQKYFNLPMTKNSQAFNITIDKSNYTQLGSTCHGIICYDGNSYEDGSQCRTVTYDGTLNSIENIYIYIIALAILIIIGITIAFVANRLNGQDTTNEEGIITYINPVKNMKEVLWYIVWIIGLACLFIVSNIGYAFLPNPMIGKLFLTLFQVMFWFTIIALPIMVIRLIVKAFQNKELQRQIDRGLEIGSA